MGDVLQFKGKKPDPKPEASVTECYQCYWCDCLSFIIHTCNIVQCARCGAQSRVTITPVAEDLTDG